MYDTFFCIVLSVMLFLNYMNEGLNCNYEEKTIFAFIERPIVENIFPFHSQTFHELKLLVFILLYI